jgi:cobalt transporter subunit CbtA|tara:strand:- start:722 stop:1408 length:687 start_codon:yes stop_codon:yes gene_type:complete
MFKNIFVSAVVCGAIAGVLATVMQMLLVTPLLMEAELFETGQSMHFITDGSPESPIKHVDIWEDPYRHLMTLCFNLVTFTGFGFILIAAMAFFQKRGFTLSKAEGIVAGVSGFIVFQLAPSVGLPPELPGTIGVTVGLKQTWWIITILSTTVGILLLFLDKHKVVSGVGIIFITIPHLIGHPKLETYFGVAPPELAAEFASRALAVSLIAWIILGVISSQFWKYLEKD